MFSTFSRTKSPNAMSFQANNINLNTIPSQTNEPKTLFGRYNNTWEEVFDIRWHVSQFMTTAVKRIYGAGENSCSSNQLADYIRDNQLTVFWSVVPGIDATHHCFVNGPWNSPSHQHVCNGPTIDVPLNHTNDSFQRFVLSSLGYNSSDSLETNCLNYKADMQLLHGYRKQQWARYCILRIRLPSLYQLTGQNDDNAWSVPSSTSSSHRPDFVPILPRRQQASPSPQPNTNQEAASGNDSNASLPQFTVLRKKPNSLFVTLNTHEPLPEVYECPALYHRPLYLKYDPISNAHGYWIGRHSFIATNLI